MRGARPKTCNISAGIRRSVEIDEEISIGLPVIRFKSGQLVAPMSARGKFGVQIRAEFVKTKMLIKIWRLDDCRARRPGIAVVITQAQTHAGRVRKTPAEISGKCPVAKAIVWALTVRLEIRSAGGIIELSQQSGKFRSAAAG